jgi:hypothetical protein
MANATADTRDVSETKLARMKKDELREYARGIGLKNVDDLKKPELLAQVKDRVYADAHGGRHRDGSGTSRNGQAAGGKGARRTAAKGGKGTKGVGWQLHRGHAERQRDQAGQDEEGRAARVRPRDRAQEC